MSKRVALVGMAVAVGCALAACTDLTPLQSQVKDLQSQAARLTQEQSTAKTSTDNAARSAHEAADAAGRASSKADQAVTLAQANKKSIDDINEKMERMFRRRLSK
jgi:uncharacterized protein HemX